MTALVILIIAVAALVVVTGAVTLQNRQVRNKALLELCQSQKSVILKLEKEAMLFGMADPLANIVLNTIHDARMKENSK